MSYDAYRGRIIEAARQWNDERDHGSGAPHAEGGVDRWQPPHLVRPDNYDHLTLEQMTDAVSAMHPKRVDEAATAWRALGTELAAAVSDFSDSFMRTIDGTSGPSGWTGAAASAAAEAVTGYQNGSVALAQAAHTMSQRLGDMRTGLEQTRLSMPADAGAAPVADATLPTSGALKAADHRRIEAEEQGRRVLREVYGRVVAQTDVGMPYMPAAPRMVADEAAARPDRPGATRAGDGPGAIGLAGRTAGSGRPDVHGPGERPGPPGVDNPARPDDPDRVAGSDVDDAPDDTASVTHAGAANAAADGDADVGEGQDMSSETGNSGAAGDAPEAGDRDPSRSAVAPVDSVTPDFAATGPAATGMPSTPPGSPLPATGAVGGVGSPHPAAVASPVGPAALAATGFDRPAGVAPVGPAGPVPVARPEGGSFPARSAPVTGMPGGAGGSGDSREVGADGGGGGMRRGNGFAGSGTPPSGPGFGGSSVSSGPPAAATESGAGVGRSGAAWMSGVGVPGARHRGGEGEHRRVPDYLISGAHGDEVTGLGVVGDVATSGVIDGEYGHAPQ